MKYIVTKYEVWAQPVEVEAEDADEALRKVSHEQGVTILADLFEYSHDVPADNWKVEKA